MEGRAGRASVAAGRGLAGDMRVGRWGSVCPVHTCVRVCREESGALEPPDTNIPETLSPGHLLSPNTIDRVDDFIDSKSTEG